MTTADTAIELTQLEWNVKDRGIDGDSEDRRIQQLEFLKPHPIAAPEKLDSRRSQVGLPPFADQAERPRRHHTDPSSLSASVVAVPRPAVERPAA